MAYVDKVSRDGSSITLVLKSGKSKTYPAEIFTDPVEEGDIVKLYKDENGELYISPVYEEEDPEEAHAEVKKPGSSKSSRSSGKKSKGKSKVNSEEWGTSGLAVASLVISIIAFIFSFIPIVNNLAFFIGILAIVFAAVCLAKHRSKGMSIAGLVLGILSIVVTLYMQYIWAQALDTASDEFNEAMATYDSAMSDVNGENTEQILQNDLDVSFGQFTSETDEYGFGSSSLTVTITNKSSDSFSGSIEIEAVDSTGKRLSTDYAYVSNLAAGQAQDFEVFTLVSSDEYDAYAAASFDVVSISKY